MNVWLFYIPTLGLFYCIDIFLLLSDKIDCI